MTDPTEQPRPCALVVDDDAFIRLDALDILEDAGFETLEAADADAALVLLRERHPDLSVLYTDVQMPGGLDGFALARHAAGHWPHICIVVASGQATPGADDLPDGAHFIANRSAPGSSTTICGTCSPRAASRLRSAADPRVCAGGWCRGRRDGADRRRRCPTDPA